MGYRVMYHPEAGHAPVVVKDDSGTTSWRDAKKALREWYLDAAKSLRQVSEKDYFASE